MRLAGSTRCSLDPREERSLAWMARDHRRPSPPADDGDLSGADSPEEAHGKRFERGPSRAPRSGVWGYSYSRNYAPELYNLAWARAVQNKPLGLDLVDPAAAPEEEVGVVEDVLVGAEDGAEAPGEKEEGELEEGEIEFGAEVAAEGALNEPEKELEEEKAVEEVEEDIVEEMGDFDRQVSLILEELEAVTEEEVEK